MKLLRAIFLLLPFVFSVSSGQTTYVVQKGKKYISYKVQTGDGLYGLSKKYHVSQQEIIDANPKTGSRIMVGTTILIPVSTAPKPDIVSANGKAIYYTTKKNETLYSIASANNVSVDDLKKWNKFNNNAVFPGKKIIVGYETEKIKEAKKEEVHPKDEDYIDPKYSEDYKKKGSANTEVKEVDEKSVAGWIDDGSVISNKSLALHKTAPAGTIIKLTNLMNGKTQFVKIIGKLPDDPENPEVSIKITKSMARKLGVLDKYFRVQLHYSMEIPK